MKKIFALLLVMVSLTFCACGGGNTSNTLGTLNRQNTSDDKIDLGSVVLVDDETVTIKAVSFYYLDMGGSLPETSVCFEVTNNLDREIFFSTGYSGLYLGDVQVSTYGLEGIQGPLPGKTGQYNYLVRVKDGGEETPVDSLEKLYELNGTFSVDVMKEDKKNYDEEMKKEYYFDLSTLK